MTSNCHNRHYGIALAACFCFEFAAAGAARASVITTSPTLPLLGVPYTSPVGVGCFPVVSACVTLGQLTLTTPVTSTFNALGQDILTGANYTATLTSGGTVTGTVTLTGTAEQEVLGRTFATETGSWTTDLTGLSLSGSVFGHVLDVTLDTAAGKSTGTTSIMPLVTPYQEEFRIVSFFDVFVDITLEGTGLSTGRGPIPIGAGIPEPASLALLVMPLLVLPVLRRRRR